MLFWHVPAPNEALLISGSKRQQQDTQFRIVTGHGSFVMPTEWKSWSAGYSPGTCGPSSAG
jgi:flotillin